jgi:hypothetical protein
MSAFPPLAISAGLGRGESYRPAAIGAVKLCFPTVFEPAFATCHLVPSRAPQSAGQIGCTRSSTTAIA